MRVLFLTPRMPHRWVISGHAIVYQRMRRLLERGYEIGLACFTRPGEESLQDEWRGRLVDLQTVPDPSLDRRRPLAAALYTGVPPPFSAWRSEAMRRLVGDMVERDHYDLVIAEFSSMGQFLHRNPSLPAVRRIISCHQCATVASRVRTDLLGYSLPGLVERLWREPLRRFEFDMYRSVDRVLVLTPQERHQILYHSPDLRTAVIPSGVDTAFFKPPDPPVRRDGILFTGYYSHEPNRDAVRWFVERIWPLVSARHPELFFYIVGPDPPPEILNLAWKDPRIVVTGEVEDVRPYLGKAAVFVCPVRMGSGMRGKILEAMASEVPVVSTSLGVEGIPVQPGGNCFLADQAEIMAGQLDLLLSDALLRDTVARRARAMVTERFSWERSVQRLEEVLADVCSHR